MSLLSLPVNVIEGPVVWLRHASSESTLISPVKANVATEFAALLIGFSP